MCHTEVLDLSNEMLQNSIAGRKKDCVGISVRRCGIGINQTSYVEYVEMLTWCIRMGGWVDRNVTMSI